MKSTTEPTRAFDYCFDDRILRQYSQSDYVYQAAEDVSADELTRTIMANGRVRDRKLHPVPMGLLVQLRPVVDFHSPPPENVLR